MHVIKYIIALSILFCFLVLSQCFEKQNRIKETLKFSQEVFDRDRFKSDDKMGHAFLDLRPLASASKLKQALQLTTGETVLRKVAANNDNCLLADTSVTYVNGEIVLDARLKLRDVESGELYVTVKWIDHPTTTPVEKARYI